MGTTLMVELYVPKGTPRHATAPELVYALRQEGLDVVTTGDLAPRIGPPSSAVRWVGPEAAQPEDAVFAVLAGGGGSLSLEGNFAALLGLYPFGWPGYVTRARELGEVLTDGLPVGVIRFSLDLVSDDEDIKRFATAVDVTRRLYPIVQPIFGMGHTSEIWNPKLFNLIPTEANVMKHGPRDFFSINVWGPSIIQNIEWRRLKEISPVIAHGFEDGGVMAWVKPEHFAEERSNCVHLMEAEIVLGWHGNVDVNVFRALMRLPQVLGGDNPDLHSRLMGWQWDQAGRLTPAPKAEATKNAAFVEIGLPERASAVLREENGIWHKFAIRLAEEIATGNLSMTSDERMAFQRFLEKYA